MTTPAASTEASTLKPRASLYYVHDPMCSWCWAYSPVFAQLERALKNQLNIKTVLGGLAADTDEIMPEAMQQQIAGYWHKIAATTDTEFNHSFWKKNQPRRATYPAARAVIAARLQKQESAMILAIQHAYYLRAMNPSDDDILLQIADELGLDFDRFLADFYSEQVAKQLLTEIEFSRAMGVNSFPSLMLKTLDGRYHKVAVDYHSSHSSLASISALLAIKV